jgi:hypothetical protein
VIQYVAQPNDYGCAIASVAMVAGESYRAMEAWFIEQGLSVARMQQGLHSGIWMEALARLGFVYEQRYMYDALKNEPRAEWPPRPFAPAHVCVADVAAGSHAFVMLDDGRVFDPFNAERMTLAHPDYLKISQVIGVRRRP